MKKLLEQLLGQSGDEGAKVPSLSPTEAKILQLLIRHGEMYGLEMVEESDGDIKRGTVYVTLQRMTKKGFVESRQEETPSATPGLPRRLYRITGAGADALRTCERVAHFLGKGLVTP